MGSLKKLYGYYPTTGLFLPIVVDANGKIILSNIPGHHKDHEDGGSDEIDVTGLVGLPDAIPQYLIAKWVYSYGGIPTGWSLYEVGETSGGDDVLTGGTPTACGSTYPIANAVDDNEDTFWWHSGATPHWYKYDFGAGVGRAIVKFRSKGNAGYLANAFNVQGSNNDSDWDTLYSGNMANNANWQEFTWTNTTEYRYIKINFTSSYHGSGDVSFYEFKAMEDIVALWDWIKKD